MISTLHRLVDGGIADRHEFLPPLDSVVLILPCHYAEIGTAALDDIVRILDEAKFLFRVRRSTFGGRGCFRAHFSFHS
jgi:hypothetical protein